ncbi:hypothetical protein FB561_7257 [Kribbella amoyensis]|uniref:PH (Pleckstrin Homology) domain-containing protein n=1 Tax=Kribbella amoyensis TaxID=996641 RepID=A0A561B3B4_9ACTN|nr:hypothetical protein [Kribbella amoyensis]TWD73368.1 hypothetical protein FB561_7257 [Kribbella amoyensis]
MNAADPTNDAERIGRWEKAFAGADGLRVPPRRNLMIRRLVVFGLLVLATGWPVLSAVLGNSEWRGWPVFCAVCLPFFLFFGLQTGRALLTGRPVLVVDRTGIAVGKQQLAWPDITAIDLQKKNLPQGLQSIGITAGNRRLDLTEEHLENLSVFERWLERVWKKQTTHDD